MIREKRARARALWVFLTFPPKLMLQTNTGEEKGWSLVSIGSDICVRVRSVGLCREKAVVGEEKQTPAG